MSYLWKTGRLAENSCECLHYLVGLARQKRFAVTVMGSCGVRVSAAGLGTGPWGNGVETCGQWTVSPAARWERGALAVPLFIRLQHAVWLRVLNNLWCHSSLNPDDFCSRAYSHYFWASNLIICFTRVWLIYSTVQDFKCLSEVPAFLWIREAVWNTVRKINALGRDVNPKLRARILPPCQCFILRLLHISL